MIVVMVIRSPARMSARLSRPRSVGSRKAGTVPTAQPYASWPLWLTALAAVAGVIITGIYGALAQDTTSQSMRAEQFGRSIEQLGSTSGDVRVGAIHSIGMLIAQDSAYRAPGCETLGLYLNERLPRTTDEPVGVVGADIKAVLVNLGRYCAWDSGNPAFLPLSTPNVDLSQASLPDVEASGINLSQSNLDRSDLSGTNLSHATLLDSDAKWADLRNTNLTGADLTGVDFYGANLTSANLSGANLAHAELAQARLYGVNFDGADLSKANLRGRGREGEPTITPSATSGAGLSMGGDHIACNGTIWPTDMNDSITEYQSAGRTFCRIRNQ